MSLVRDSEITASDLSGLGVAFMVHNLRHAEELDATDSGQIAKHALRNAQLRTLDDNKLAKEISDGLLAARNVRARRTSFH